MEYLGYKRIDFNTDQEEAPLKLKDIINREWGGEMVVDESPVKES